MVPQVLVSVCVLEMAPTSNLTHTTGRTTFVNTLCSKTVLPHKDSDDANVAHVEDGVKIKPITVGQSISKLACIINSIKWLTSYIPGPSELELDEEGTRISLTIVDTPGFGDQIDNEARYVPLGLKRPRLVSRISSNAAKLTTRRSFSEIVGYLERQYDDILAEESRIKRNPRFRDNRVHVLLYFITPTGHGLVPSPLPLAELLRV